MHAYLLAYKGEAETRHAILFWYGATLAVEPFCPAYADVAGIAPLLDTFEELGCPAGPPPYLVPPLPDL